MSQSILPISDNFNTFGTNPAWSALAASNPVVASILHTDPPGLGELTAPGCSINIATPVEVPLVDDLITLELDFGEIVSSASKKGIIQVTHPQIVGIIADLSFNGGSEFDVNVALSTSMSILASTFFANIGLNYPADSATFFADGFIIFAALSFGPTNPLDPGFAGSCSISNYSFTVPSASGADIEYTGEGGVELDSDISAMFFSSNHYIGEGGVIIGSIGAANLVLSADVSGIYTLVPGRHFDRIYTRNVNPDDTADVAIPTPFGKTGFFSG
jgi:hypothetical protein